MSDNEPVDAEIVEETPPPVIPIDYTEGGVPTFDYVRDRIENRIATAGGSQELPAESGQAATLDEQLAAREKAGRDKLEEIRRAMRGE
jgi:phage shock protein A